MLETPFSLFISKKPGEIPIFGTFISEKRPISISVYISLKINIFRPAMFYYVIVTSYVDRCSCWYQWKEETLPYTMVPNKRWQPPHQEDVSQKRAQEDEGRRVQDLYIIILKTGGTPHAYCNLVSRLRLLVS